MNGTLKRLLLFSRPTSTLFAILLLGLILNTTLLHEEVLTRRVYHQLLGNKLEAYRIDELVVILDRLSVWNYVLAPFLLGMRLLLTALILQMPLVFRGIDVPFSRLFHVVTVAFFALLLMMLVKTLWLASLPVAVIDERTLSLMPLSLTALVNPNRYSPRVLSFLGNFNLFEWLWCALVSIGLRLEARFKWLDATLVSVGVWTAILLLQFILMLYFNEVQG